VGQKVVREPNPKPYSLNVRGEFVGEFVGEKVVNERPAAVYVYTLYMYTYTYSTIVPT